MQLEYNGGYLHLVEKAPFYYNSGFDSGVAQNGTDIVLWNDNKKKCANSGWMSLEYVKAFHNCYDKQDSETYPLT